MARMETFTILATKSILNFSINFILNFFINFVLTFTYKYNNIYNVSNKCCKNMIHEVKN